MASIAPYLPSISPFASAISLEKAATSWAWADTIWAWTGSVVARYAGEERMAAHALSDCQLFGRGLPTVVGEASFDLCGDRQELGVGGLDMVVGSLHQG